MLSWLGLCKTVRFARANQCGSKWRSKALILLACWLSRALPTAQLQAGARLGPESRNHASPGNSRRI